MIITLSPMESFHQAVDRIAKEIGVDEEFICKLSEILSNYSTLVVNNFDAAYEYLCDAAKSDLSLNDEDVGNVRFLTHTIFGLPMSEPSVA